MKAEDRLLNLFSMLDGGEITAKSRAKAAAFAAGFEYVENIILRVKSCTALKVFTHPTREYIDNLLDGTELSVSRERAVVTAYDAKTIGKIIADCIYSRCNVNLGSNGLSWQQMKEKAASWSQIRKLRYRWDMIESR